MVTVAKVFTWDEVFEHNTFKDCWLTINGKVYDVTKFVEDHPGGPEALLSSTGKDATTEFEETGHSKNARQILEGFYIGELDTTSIPTKRAKFTSSMQSHDGKDKISETIIKLRQYLVPVAISGMLVGIRFYYYS